VGSDKAPIGSIPVMGENGSLIWKIFGNNGIDNDTTYIFNPLIRNNNETYGFTI
jgi:hypothetical protein